ncbi:MAG: dihydropteroate synthase [Elusimicrobiota bacterium]
MGVINKTGTGPVIMGILNVTPDSFYDGGKYSDSSKALDRARRMADEGAEIIDIGGESTRPGAEEVSLQKELDRVIPLIEDLRKELDISISCDTSKSAVAREALNAGADIINDVTGFTDPVMRKTVAEKGKTACIMHMLGDSRTMQESPVYSDVLSEIKEFLYEQARVCEKEGIAPGNIIVDPGIGFGKTLEHNIKILANADYFAEKYPVLIGASRKSFIGNLLDRPVEDRLAGSIAVAAYAALKNTAVLRVHDVKATRDAVMMIKALKEKEDE